MSFPRYSRYRDSGVEWLGEVPEHWDVARLKRIAHVSPSNVDKKTCDGEAPVRLCNYTDVYHNDLITPGAEFMPATASAEQIEKFTLRAGDTIVTKDSETADDIAVAAYVPEDVPGVVCGYHLSLIRPRGSQTGAFIKRFFDSAFAKASVQVRANGLTRVGLTQYALDNLPVPVPPSAERTAIAGFLDGETGKIDALISEQRRLIQLLQEKRRALIFRAVTRGLDPDAPMRPSGLAWLGDVPAHWKMLRLKHLSPSVTVGIVVNPSTWAADHGLPFIHGGDIREGRIDWENARRISPEHSSAHAKTQLRAGDLLTVRVGAPGVTAVVPDECEGGNCASVMLIRQGAFNSCWLSLLMNTRVVRFQVEVVQYGAAQEQFNVGHAVNFWLPVPPWDEQDEIVEYLHARTSRLDLLMDDADAAIALLQERRTALISAAVTGRIDVRGRAEAA